MVLAIVVNSIVRYIAAQIVCGSLHIVCRISHCDPDANPLQHFNIVGTVPKCKSEAKRS